MVQNRLLKLQEILSGIPGVSKAYFQPPANLSMSFPCIVYERDAVATVFANNTPYRHTNRYQVTVIDQDPDSEIPAGVEALPLSSFSRHFTADGLHHDVYNLYF